jgi:hypothetical protein
MGSFDGAIIWAIGLLVVMTIAITAVLPGVLTAIDGSDVTGTATGEVWAGTAATAHAMDSKPIIEVTDFRKSAYLTSYNDTKISGNASVNNSTSVPFTFTTPIDTTADSNLTVNISKGTGSAVNVSINGVFLGAASGGVETWKTANLIATNPAVITFTMTGANISNVTNVSVKYGQFATNTNYSITSKQAGTITPTVSGTFYTTYTYGTTGTYGMKLILDLVPLMIGVILLLLVITSSGWL